MDNWPAALAAVVTGLLSVVLQLLRGRRIAAHQGNERLRYEVILKIADSKPELAADLLKAVPMPSKPDMGMTSHVLLILGAATALSSLAAPTLLTITHRSRPSCAEPRDPADPIESASAPTQREPSSINLHSTLAHMDPADVWAARQGDGQ